MEATRDHKLLRSRSRTAPCSPPRRWLPVILAAGAFLAIHPGAAVRAHAAAIELRLDVSADRGMVAVTVANVGRDPAPELLVEVSLADQEYSQPLDRELNPGDSWRFMFPVEVDGYRGARPLVTRAGYTNDGRRLSVLNAVAFPSDAVRLDIAPPRWAPVHLADTAQFDIHHAPGAEVRVVFPHEIPAWRCDSSSTRTTFATENTVPGLELTYDIFAIVESQSPEGIWSCAISRNRLHVTAGPPSRPWPTPGPRACLVAMAVGGALAFVLYRRTGKHSIAPGRVAMIRWLFGISLYSSLYLWFQHGHLLIDMVQSGITSLSPSSHAVVRRFVDASTETLALLKMQGRDYDLFRTYVATPLYLYLCTLHLLAIRFVIRPDTRTDKPWHLMLAVFSVWDLSRPRRITFDRHLAHQAVLSLLVKIFFLPMLVSWSINNVIYQDELIRDLSISFHDIQRFLIASLILIDVAIFSLGYLTELPQLRNRIRSVEPTLLGWAVCLVCYPPYNRYFFAPFESGWSGNLAVLHLPLEVTVLSLTVLLWAVYVWATVALGLKASNLTNRGIVASGPYRFVRHPAYAAKLTIWILSCLFLAQKSLPLTAVLVVVYGLRAWTEERHLAADPDYLAYKEKVTRRFIPGII